MAQHSVTPAGTALEAAGNAPPSGGGGHDHILILDFGSQVTQLIARRVRESGVYCEVWPYTADDARIRAFAPRGIILSGGPSSVTEGNSPRAPNFVFASACRCSASATGSRPCARSSAVRWKPGTIVSSAVPWWRSRITAP